MRADCFIDKAEDIIEFMTKAYYHNVAMLGNCEASQLKKKIIIK